MRTNPVNLSRAMGTATHAARAAGRLMRRCLHQEKRANLVTQHDIKLELDVRAQKLIQKLLYRALPQVALLGEEGEAGAADAAYRWVVDPIDGTVNFAYGIPHAAVSIALQQRAVRPGRSTYEDGYDTVLGVIYDPFLDELWSAVRGGKARLNGKAIHVSTRRKLAETVMSIGFAKSRQSLDAALPYFNQLIYRIRKLRMRGSAALGLAYVASGRLDAYVEPGISLWDIAAGGLLIECAGGEFWRKATAGKHKFSMIASNWLLRRKLGAPDWDQS